jgi:putative endonuclease
VVGEVHYEEFKDKILAQKREYAIKQLKRQDKLRLIENAKRNTSV